MAGRGSGGLSSARRMAASHSPHLEEGLLAQSLENHLPAFGEPTLHGISLQANSQVA